MAICALFSALVGIGALCVWKTLQRPIKDEIWATGKHSEETKQHKLLSVQMEIDARIIVVTFYWVVI